MCNCEQLTHPGIKCGSDGCECHDELLFEKGDIPILVAEDKEVVGKAVGLKRGDRVVITIEMADNSAQEILNLMGTAEADKMSWTLRMFEGNDEIVEPKESE